MNDTKISNVIRGALLFRFLFCEKNMREQRELLHVCHAQCSKLQVKNIFVCLCYLAYFFLSFSLVSSFRPTCSLRFKARVYKFILHQLVRMYIASEYITVQYIQKSYISLQQIYVNTITLCLHLTKHA